MIRLMARSVLLFFAGTLVCGSPGEHEVALARNRQEWVAWSNRTGLPVETIGQLWWRAMGADAGEISDAGIEVVDAASLRDRRQVLFVVAGGNGHCLSLYVIGNGGSDKKPLWELSQLPHNAGGICHGKMMPYPTAFAGPNGEIVVQVPSGAAWVKRGQPLGDYPVSTAMKVYRYRWNGKTYRLTASERVVTYRSDSFNAEKCTQENPCP